MYTRTKRGHGWNAVHVPTVTGLPLGRAVGPLQAPELDLVHEALIAYEANVVPHLESEGLAVFSADGAFSQNALRRRLRALGIVENIHHVSHGKDPKSLDNVAKNDAKRIPIAGYPNWFTNGHRELKCACGAGTTFRRLDKDRHGRAIARVEGSCPNCKSVTITSGEWRFAQNPSRWVRVDPATRTRSPTT